MKSKFIIASLLAAVSFSAFAKSYDIDVIDLTGGPTPFASSGALFTTTDLNGFKMDVFNFKNMAPGAYDIELLVESSNVGFDSVHSSLNGTPGAIADAFVFGKMRYYFGVDVQDTPSPFTLNLYGSTINPGKPSFYTGSILVTAVPEPETYGMLMAGLGMLGFMSRRKAAKKSI